MRPKRPPVPVSGAHVRVDEMPGGWTLLLDRLRPRNKRRYRVPSLMAYLLNVTILYSTSRQQQLRQLTDVYFSPPLQRVGIASMVTL